MAPVAVTMGDPAGIGPELCLRAAGSAVVVGSRRILERVAERLGLAMPARIVDVLPAGIDPDAIRPGQIQREAGLIAAAAIEEAIAGAKAGRYTAVVTAPIHKQAIHLAGVPFPGHTEWFAERCGVAGETMLLYHRRCAVALATVHVPLRAVPDLVTPRRLVETGRLLAAALRRIRGRPPRIAVLGCNPHAGEGGLFGDEDRRVIPAVAELLQLGIDAEGPLPPDTAFTPAARARYDGFVCWYHDQGLAPFKALCMDDGVNVTLGLPIVRTSVDHGTAFDIAWQGTADHRSLAAAIRLARRLAR